MASGLRHRRSELGGWSRSWRLVWASPNSALGLVLGLGWWLAGAQVQRSGHVLELALPPRRTRRWPFAAITLGHVVLAVSPQELQRWRAHERVHVAQYERWGPLFLPAYLASSAWQWLRGRHVYWDNRFEVEARAAPGGRGD